VTPDVAAVAAALPGMPPGHADLLLYFVIVLGIVALPGLDMGVVLACTLTGGRRAGLAAIAGVIAGGACHVTFGILGVSALLRVFPAAFNGLLMVGAAYVAWIGIQLVRSRPVAPATGVGDAALGRAFARGALTNLLNPKAYLFTLAILPQFVRPEYGSLPAQAATIFGINALTQSAVYGTVALLADRGRAAMSARPAIGLWVARVTGLMLLAAAVLTAREGWRLV
jgi:threonine/homoserine/homoserine lactone efflux protein